MSKIKDLKAREIFDSRGNPTVEVDVFLESLPLSVNQAAGRDWVGKLADIAEFSRGSFPSVHTLDRPVEVDHKDHMA